MALKSFVKISGVNNLSDARYCAGMGVDLLGFCIDPHSGNSISKEAYWAITEWLSGVEFVGEISSAVGINLNELMDEYPLHYWETNDLESIQVLKNTGKKVIFKLNAATADELLEYYVSHAELLLKADFLHLVRESDDWEDGLLDAISKVNKGIPVLLGFGLDANNVLALANSEAFYGIALEGGNEIKPGLKDFDALADILEPLEVD